MQDSDVVESHSEALKVGKIPEKLAVYMWVSGTK